MTGVVLLCLVVAISDGDPIKARCGEPGAYEQVTVRLAEIDAPEKGKPFGDRSRRHLAGLCFRKAAHIRQGATDRYGRAVARVECEGKDANAEQVRAGMAWAYTQYITDAEIKRLENAARAARIGLWADQSPVAPWDWWRPQSPASP